MSDTTDGAERLLDGLAVYTKITAEHLQADELVLFVRADRGQVAMAFKYDHGQLLIADADADGFHSGFASITKAPTLEDHTKQIRKLAQAGDRATDHTTNGPEEMLRDVAAVLLDVAERIHADEVVYYVRRSDPQSPELACRYLRGKIELAGGPTGTFARAYASFARAAPSDITEGIDEQFAMREKAMTLFSDDEEQDRMWAKLLALGVRNGVEDLHAAGAFTDEQAPAFNRLVRDRIYEALAVLRAAGDAEPDDPVMDWVIEHFDSEPDDGLSAAAPNACKEAIEAFAAEHGLSEDAIAELVEAGLAGLDETVDYFLRLGDEDAQRALSFLLLSLPDSWEEPQLRPEVAALLAAAPTKSRVASGPQRALWRISAAMFKVPRPPSESRV